VVWGSLAAVEAMRARRGENQHVVNLGSLSALGPVPGLAVYSATKHAVLGFTGSLQGDLMDAGIPITVHALCPDAADTPLLREHDHEPAAAINWSGPRLLTSAEVADQVVALLDSKRLVRAIPAWRGWGARAMALAGRPALRAAPLLRRQGDRHRIAFRQR
jgi:short-subunit dehydrogenase